MQPLLSAQHPSLKKILDLCEGHCLHTGSPTRGGHCLHTGSPTTEDHLHQSKHSYVCCLVPEQDLGLLEVSNSSIHPGIWDGRCLTLDAALTSLPPANQLFPCFIATVCAGEDGRCGGGSFDLLCLNVALPTRDGRPTITRIQNNHYTVKLSKLGPP